MAQFTKRILVVDDDVVILRLIRESLTALLQCEVDTTPSPAYAFEHILRKKYDLIILDYAMPGIDGAIFHGLISKLFEIHPPGGWKMPPLLVISGFGFEKKAQELLREPGVRGLIAKPFTIDKLVENVSALVDS